MKKKEYFVLIIIHWDRIIFVIVLKVSLIIHKQEINAKTWRKYIFASIYTLLNMVFLLRPNDHPFEWWFLEMIKPFYG